MFLYLLLAQGALRALDAQTVDRKKKETLRDKKATRDRGIDWCWTCEGDSSYYFK